MMQVSPMATRESQRRGDGGGIGEPSDAARRRRMQKGKSLMTDGEEEAKVAGKRLATRSYRLMTDGEEEVMASPLQEASEEAQ